jgi:hypothetical protein
MLKERCKWQTSIPRRSGDIRVLRFLSWFLTWFCLFCDALRTNSMSVIAFSPFVLLSMMSASARMLSFPGIDHGFAVHLATLRFHLNLAQFSCVCQVVNSAVRFGWLGNRFTRALERLRTLLELRALVQRRC